MRQSFAGIVGDTWAAVGIGPEPVGVEQETSTASWAHILG